MLSELAIENKEAFTELVKLAKQALNGELKEVKAEPAKKETKKEVKKEEAKDLSKLTVAELREMAKAKDVKGASTMKKAELIDALK